MFATVPGFLPGVVLSVIFGYFARRRAGRWLGLHPKLGWAAVVSLGIIFSATLTPLHEIDGNGKDLIVGCDFSRVGLASPDEILEFNDTILNIFLFIPLGAILALIPRLRLKALLMTTAVILPIVIETTQLLATPLDRACQSADVFDNVSGLVIGFVAGFIAAAMGIASSKTYTRGRSE